MDVHFKPQAFIPILLIMILGLVSSTKVPESDLALYQDAFYLVGELGVFEVIGFDHVSIRNTEFVFNYLMYAFNPLGFKAFVFFTSALVYYLVYRCCLMVAGNLNVYYGFVRNVAIFSCIGLMTFSLVGHLVRQYVAFSVFFYGVLLFEDRASTRFAGFLIIVSMFIHNSVALLLPLFAIFQVSKLSKTPVWFLFLLSLYVAVGLSANIYFRDAVPWQFYIDDGELSAVVVISDVALVVLTYFAHLSQREGRAAIKVIEFSIIFLAFLFVIKDYSLLLLRYYFFMELVRPVLFSYFFCCVVLRFSPGESLFLRSLVYSGMIGIFVIRFLGSPWDYSLL